MERAKIVNEFFQLQVFLNKGNKIPNIDTNIEFKIEKFGSSEYRMICISSGFGENSKIILAIRDHSRAWERGGYTEFKTLETFIAQNLNNIEKSLKCHRLYELNPNHMEDIQNRFSANLKLFISTNF